MSACSARSSETGGSQRTGLNSRASGPHIYFDERNATVLSYTVNGAWRRNGLSA
jgi:hypothetical protein